MEPWSARTTGAELDCAYDKIISDIGVTGMQKFGAYVLGDDTAPVTVVTVTCPAAGLPLAEGASGIMANGVGGPATELDGGGGSFPRAGPT